MLQERVDIVLCCWTQCLFLIPVVNLCFLSACLYVFRCTTLSRSLHSITDIQALIKLMSWICVWAGPLGVLLPGSHWYCCMLTESWIRTHYLPSWQRGQLCLCLTLMFVTHRRSCSCKLNVGQRDDSGGSDCGNNNQRMTLNPSKSII